MSPHAVSWCTASSQAGRAPRRVAEEQYEQQVVAHLAGQRLLKERPNTSFCFTTEQALLERHFGGPEVTKAPPRSPA
ncbi:hypothetical protein GCM10010390_33360 [Streptomyces mordarskii]|uniref:Uncharacterized protein n=1 Tax=Streptomyces mordarskii TaxID=1226758 RepID=A0ABP3MXE4_9ACTN